MNLHPDLIAKIESTPGVIIRSANGELLTPSTVYQCEKVEPRDVKLVEPGVTVQVNVSTGVPEKLVALIPVETKCEVNQREWKARSRRTGAAWKAVSRVFGPRLHMLAPFGLAYVSGLALLVKFVRLGGRKLDRSNLPSATKAVEDAVAFMIGADDGSPLWHPLFEQETGGEVTGVRVEMEVYS